MKKKSIYDVTSVPAENNEYFTTAYDIATLVTKKQQQYGNSIHHTGDFLKTLYPNGITPEQYDDLGVIIRMYDKLKRISNGNQGEENAWDDLMGYALLKAAPRR